MTHSEVQKKYKLSKKGKKTQEKYYHSEAKRQSERRYYYKNRFKRKVQRFTNKVIKLGLLNRKPCEVCNDKKSQAHHIDYMKPLEVMWLCNNHHTKWHRENGSGKNAYKEENLIKKRR